MVRRVGYAGIIAVSLLGLGGCHFLTKPRVQPIQDASPRVLNNGQDIIIPTSSIALHQIKVRDINDVSNHTEVTIPGRVVAYATKSGIGFETQDITTLYSQYRQAQAAQVRAYQNRKHIQDMFDHQAATLKDLTDAQSEDASTRAVLGEMETRFNSSGVSPALLPSLGAFSALVVADLPESNLGNIKVGQLATLVFASCPQIPYTSKIVAIGDVVDPSTRTIKVRFIISDSERRLKPGMFAKVSLHGEQSNLMVLPESALVTVDGIEYVFIKMSEGHFARRRVQQIGAGSVNGVSQIAIQSGVKNGERVVIEGAILLKGLSFGY